MTIKLRELVKSLEQELNARRIKDYCPNGLQVEGCSDVVRIISGVTASEALIDAAIAKKADVLLVHHGYFWKGENPCVTGMKKRRLQKLISHDISLVAFHLPLDIHPVLGNNARLAALLGFRVTGGLEQDNPDSIGLFGELEEAMTLQALSDRIDQKLQRKPQAIAGGEHLIKTIGWCTGGAQGYIDKAIDLGLDAFLSGEISEPTVHAARENSIHYLAAGHHATERYGVQALGEWLVERYGLEHEFIDIDNPV